MLINGEIDDELLTDTTVTVNDLVNKVYPKSVKRSDVNQDGTQDYIMFFETQQLFGDVDSSDREQLLNLSVIYDNYEFNYSQQVEAVGNSKNRSKWTK